MRSSTLSTKHGILAVFVSLLAVATSPQTAAAERVARVIDGDTILLEDGRKIRYAAINAPEEGDPGFHESTQANNRLVGGKDVRFELVQRKPDKHQRLLAYVYVGQTLVQADLVRQGWAIVTRTGSAAYRGLLRRHQEEARLGGRGIWARGEHRGKVIVVKVHPRESGEKSTNDEYVVFKNVGGSPLDMTGWSIADEMNQSYLVPQFILGAGKSVTLYTGSGKNSTDALYWGRRKTVWNRSGDTIIIKDSTRHFVLSHTY